MKRLSSRFHLALGLCSLLLSIVLLAIYLGLVPDRDHAVRASRATLAETIAVSCSALLDRGDAPALRETLGFILMRNPEILSAGVRDARGELVVDLRGHARHWRVASDAYSVDEQIQVPIWQSKQRWGTVELRFAPLSAGGWRGIVFDSRVKLAAFLVLAAFAAFYFYLKRMLRHLDPAQAVPARVRAALDTLAEGLLVLDPKGYIVLANNAFAQVVGTASDALIGRAVGTLAWIDAHEHSVPADTLPWRETISDGLAQRNRTAYLRNAQGERRTFRVNCTPVLGAGVKNTPVLVSLDDVTEIEQKEIELEAARTKAESANQIKSDFLANMSHEIRTPMNAILGFTELLRRGSARKGQDLRKHLDTIHSSGTHLLGLINDILDLSKVEAGRIEVERIDCSPLRVLREVSQVLGIKAQEKGIALALEFGGAIPARVMADPARLRQIVTNLVGNAIKFTQQGAVRVTPRLQGKNADALLVIDVADSGIGIPPDKLDSIFDPFTQAESSTTRRFGGTGLGLTISRQFARALGGDITVTSTPGAGSVFSISFATGPLEDVPMLGRDAFDAVEAHSAEAVGAADGWQFEPLEVLVVDDGVENRELVRLVLEEYGLRVTEAENGQAALDRIAHGSFAAILMDVQMPVMDGFTATRRLRASGCTLPVIALTAHAMKGFEQEVEAAGFSGYLTKPIDIDRMLETLAKQLGGARRGADAVVPAATPAASAGEPIVSRLAHHPRLRRVVIAFSEQLNAKLQVMDEAWSCGDFEAVASLAHWLKGSGGTVGYDAFFEPARLLEEMAKAGEASRMADAIAELHALAARLLVPDEPAANSPAAAPALRSA
ncbi:MAG: response regulator [Betaproteobacteria bacterium]|nr:response regulator [Betaproteobacteria bacterium]